MEHRTIGLALLMLAAAWPFGSATAAGCQSELRILADDLHGVELSQQQTQDIAGMLMLARRHCWVHHEKIAMDLINRARVTAGLKPSTGEFDWEHVPLESLEKDN